MKIGELAEQLKTTISALRFYEQKGLVHPGRSEGGTRQYSEEDARRFQAILDFAALDIPLEQIKALARVRESSSTGNQASRKAQAHLHELEETLTALRDRLDCALDDISQARRKLEACHGCLRKPVRSVCEACPVAPDLLDCQVMRVIWDEELHA